MAEPGIYNENKATALRLIEEHCDHTAYSDMDYDGPCQFVPTGAGEMTYVSSDSSTLMSGFCPGCTKAWLVAMDHGSSSDHLYELKSMIKEV